MSESSDVRAAAERLREHRRVCLVMRHPRESPYTHLEVSTGAAELIPGAEQKDLLTLANAYLAEHPADDGEPADADWLRSVGFLPDGDVDKPDAPLAIGLYYGRTDDEIENGIVAGRHLLIGHAGDAMVEEYDEGGTVVGCVEMPSLPTRGHVRRLCAALGVALPERSDP